MTLKAFPLALIATTIAAASAFAAQLSQADLDAAVASVSKIEEPGIGECLRNAGTSVGYETEQRDLNNDGRNEVIVRTFPKEFGKGGTGCFGMVGQNIYVAIANNKGEWSHNLGYDTAQLKYHERGDGKFPDIELIGGGFCFPIWRYYQGSYGIWKTCDDNNNLIFADTAKWVNDGIPRDADESAEARPAAADATLAAYARETNLKGPEFWHNDSLMVADPKRGLIIYKKPKKSISNSVKPGDVLFRGRPWDLYESEPGMQGTAYIFRKGCAPEPYAVSGGQRQSWHTLVLRGEAPVRAKKGCDIVSKTRQGGNAELIFESAID